MDNKPWLLIEVVHPELQPTRFAQRDCARVVNVDALLFSAGFVTAAHDKVLPYPERYPLIVYVWRGDAHDTPRPERGFRKTRARHPTYAECRDRAVALRRAAAWGPPRGARAE